jgi:trehalose/maltose transport system permease protein
VTAAAEATTEARSVAKVRVHKPLRKRLARLPFYLLIAAIFVYTIFPFYWAIRSSLTPDGDLFATPLQYFPSSPTLAHYREVLGSGDFQRALLNSTIVAGSVTLISLVLGAVASYALGRFRFRGRAFAMYLMLSMTIFPQIAILAAINTMISLIRLY